MSIVAVGKAEQQLIVELGRYLAPSNHRFAELFVLQRAQVGLKKYGVSSDRTDLTLADWERHELEELLDAYIYAYRAGRKHHLRTLLGMIQELIETR